MASPITIPSLSLEVIELDNSDEEWKPPPESDEDGVINISSDSDTDNAMPRSRGGSSSSKTSRRSSTFSSNKSSDKHLRLCDAQRKKPKSPLKKRKDVPKARKNALHQLIAQTAEKSKLKTPEPGSFSRRMGESSSCMRQTALSFNKKPPTYETSSQRPRDSVTTPKRGRRRSFNKDAVTAFAAKGVLPDDERVKYNQMMEKAKWAEERGDDKAGLKWYFKANRVSELDEVLANRIRSFGPPALQQLKDERSSDKKQNPFASLLFPEQSPLQIRQQRRENMQTKGGRQRARNATLMHPAPSPLQTRGQRGQRKLPATGKARPAPVVICLDD